MKTVPWNRSARVEEIGDRLWGYLSPATRFEEPGLVTAAALLGWPASDVTRLGQLQFMLSKEVGHFLDVLPTLLRALTISTNRQEEIDFERIRGPVSWNRTLALRAAGGSTSIWVTGPARRDHQTAENEMLVHVLDSIIEVARTSGWENSTTQAEAGSMLRERLQEAEYWQQSRPLRQVERRPLAPRDVMRVRSGRAKERYATVIDAYDQLTSLIGELDRQTIRRAIEQAALVTTLPVRL